MNDIIYDYIIIGGGIAGLYANYKLNNKYNCLLLEKNDYFGGRSIEIDFHGSSIKLGAGIITDDNIHLKKLLNELKIDIFKFESKKNSLLNFEFDIDNANKLIKQKYNSLKKSKHKDITLLNVKQFLLKYFGAVFTKKYIKSCEYMDFLKSDIEYYIKYYKIDDMTFTKETIYGLQWQKLTNALTLPNCIKNTEIKKIIKNNNLFIINNLYKSKNIIIATTLKNIDSLIGKFIDFNYDDYIGSVPFVRIYTWHKNKYNSDKLKNYNIVSNELQKIIKYGDNILMASYCDSKNALFWKKIMHLTKTKQKEIIENKLDELNIGINKIDDFKLAFWNDGVHYYKPIGNNKFNNLLKQFANPSKNIYVVGEMVSKKQGYVEGAIESVNRFIKSI